MARSRRPLIATRGYQVAKGDTQLSPELVAARKLLAQQLAPTAPAEGKSEEKLGLEDQLQVIDRLIKIELLEHRLGQGKSGSGFD